MIDLVLVKKHMLCYVQDLGAVRGMGLGRGISNDHVVLCKVRLVGIWIKRREVVCGARRITSEKLTKHENREGYARSLEGKRVGWNGENNVENMWEIVKRAMVESAREVHGSVKVGGGNPKSVWWNDQVKAAVKKNEAAWKKALGTRDKDTRERGLEVHKKEKTKVKRCIYQSKKKVQEQFGRKMNQDMNGNRKLFRKEVRRMEERWRIPKE